MVFKLQWDKTIVTKYYSQHNESEEGGYADMG